MGLSSNTRLLTITARLTSNEYESQQITNAKLRLATQSQQASDEYLQALNQQSYSFITYDGNGEAINNDFSANILYQYADKKNQYLLANASGVPLVSKQDARDFASSGTLQQFLASKGIGMEYKSDTLATLARAIDSYVEANGTTKWEKYVNRVKASDPTGTVINPYTGSTSSEPIYTYWLNNKDIVAENYKVARADLDNLVLENNTVGGVDRNDINALKEELNKEYEIFSQFATFGTFLEHLYPTATEVRDFQTYKNNLADYTAELERLNLDPDDAYTYTDPTRAQWYTNLWFRMNGDSTVKSSSANYQVISSELASSPTWVRDSLQQGILTIEQAAYTNENNTIPDESNPLVMKLNGIKWTSKMLANCVDIVQKDDSSRIAKAEAQYQKRTAEINSKDEKFQRKISLLNSEHQALQTEYDSVKSAMEKNIDRSFKTFNS